MKRDGFKYFYRLAVRVMNFYTKIDADILSAKNFTGIDCKYGCGICCEKESIEAAPLEFFPLAVDIFYKNQIDLYLNLLENNKNGVCIYYNKNANFKGLCSNYEYRGLICRLFGFSTLINKYNSPRLVACDLIKQSDGYKKIQLDDKNLVFPSMSESYSRFYDISPNDCSVKYPINEAIKKAIDKMLFTFSFNKRVS